MAVESWLLNHLATWEIAILIVGAAVALSVGGFLLVLRYAPHWRHQLGPDVGNTFRGVGVSIFVIALAFSIVTLYQSNAAAGQSVRDEAAALAQMVRDADAFPPATRDALRKAALGYIEAATTVEWPLMRDGKPADQAQKANFDAIYAALFAFRPSTSSEQVFYQQEAQKVNDLIATRRVRLSHGNDELPAVVEALLLFGAALAIFSTYIPRSNSMTLAVTTVVLNAAFIGVALLTAVLLSHPFSGSYSVSDGPFFQGALGRLVAGAP